jgi:hypothetical protein
MTNPRAPRWTESKYELAALFSCAGGMNANFNGSIVYVWWWAMKPK